MLAVVPRAGEARERELEHGVVQPRPGRNGVRVAAAQQRVAV